MYSRTMEICRGFRKCQAFACEGAGKAGLPMQCRRASLR